MVGRISVLEAWNVLKQDPGAVLVDVRTPVEWQGVGLPDIATTGRDVVTITWDPYQASGFAAALEAAVPDRATPVLFLCRSGARSQMTAELAEHLGYVSSFNVVEGFEGPPDATGERGRVCGWQFEKLPVRFPE